MRDTDVTDRKLSEQAVMELNARLVAANEQIRTMKEELEREQVSSNMTSRWNRATTRLWDEARQFCGC